MNELRTMPTTPSLALIHSLRGGPTAMPPIMVREDRAASLVGQTLDGRYRIDELLGSGSSAAVYRGTHLRLARTIAIKVLHDDLWRDPRARARFEREARGAARLEHPNCVGVTDVGSSGALGYIVMPFISGRELGDVVPFGMSRSRAIELFEQLLMALEHAHALGLVHRDVKPENILLTHDHAGRTVLKLADFGIAKLVDAGNDAKISLVGEVLGTPAYMSPEQIRSESVSEQTDLYAAGLVFFEMLTGRRVYDGEDVLEILRKQVHEEADLCEVDAALRPVLEGLLAKKPSDRFSTASDALAALRAAAALPLLEHTDRSLPIPGSGQSREEAPGSGAWGSASQRSGPSALHDGPWPAYSYDEGVPDAVFGSSRRTSWMVKPRRWPAVLIASIVAMLVFTGWWLHHVV